MSEIKLVDCNMCSGTRIIYRKECTYCKGSGKVQDPKTILCNMCAGPMCPEGTMNGQIPHGLHEASVIGGYDSYHLFDLTKYIFSFCEKCLRELFNQCKIPPICLDNMDFEEEYPYSRDQSAYDYRVWKDNGGCHQAYLNGKCNIIKDCPNDAIYSFFASGRFTEECSCEDHLDKHYAFAAETVKPFIPNHLRIFL